MIKYRVYDTEQKRYLHINNVSISGSGISRVTTYENGYHTVISQLPNEKSPRFIVEQYTGLKDKNGTDIYEGDIVQVKPSLVGKVVYNNKYACFEIVGPGFPPYSFAELADAGIDIDSMVVVGNIHENGELLEKGI